MTCKLCVLKVHQPVYLGNILLVTSVSVQIPSKFLILFSVSSQTSIVTQQQLSVSQLVSILTILPNWSGHSHFAWLTSVETVKTQPDKHKCFPGFSWPISVWSGSTCFSYRRNSRENIGGIRNERIVMEWKKAKTIKLLSWLFLEEFFFFLSLVFLCCFWKLVILIGML